MEITLDLAYVRGILAQERDRARSEIREVGVTQAYENSRDRHDWRIAAAPDVGTLACRSGCTWCCYFSVDVRAVEAIAILDFVEHTFTAEQKARVLAEVRANSAALKNLDEMERMRRNLKCAFLIEGRCSIYAARPQTCRNYHATDAAGCQQSYEDPDNLDIDPEFAPYVYQAGGAHVDAFTSAMREAGYDSDVYEFNNALEAALSEPGVRERFEAKAAPFISLQGDEVPSEFDGLDED
jgi:Fe-S-cluster containining protein